MTTVTLENLPKNSLKITVTVPHADVQPFLDAAAARISEQTSIPGFRPGKAGFDVVKQRVGEQKIYEEALEGIVRKTFVEAVTSNEVETVGSPKIDVEKLAPGNDIVYTATVALMPKVLKLADWKKLSIVRKPHEATEEDLTRALTDLQHVQTKESRAASGSAAADVDKVVVSMNMKKDGVPVEGGQSPNHAIYLTENYYVPGFKEEVVGMKEGEQKTFTLTFPENHTSKLLAGAAVEFDVTLKEIYTLEHPELDDAFATALGQKSMEELRALLQKNIGAEKEHEEKGRQDREILEALAKDSNFDDIPDLLLNEEINKMIHELEQGAAEQGMEFPEYLKSIKKTIADLKLEFAQQALMRIKVALILRRIIKDEAIDVTDAEVTESLDKIAEKYQDKESHDRIYGAEYRAYVGYTLRNRKALEKLREEIVK